MSQRFLLPCSCGRTIPVGVSQAGSSVTCECGKSVAVPTIRGLKVLTPETQASPPSPKPAATDFNGVNIQGALFVLGGVLLLVGLAVGGYYGYVYSQIDTTDHSAKYAQLDEEYIDKMGPTDLMRMWLAYSRDGLGEQVSPEHVILREMSAAAFRWMVAGIGTAALGIALVGYSIAGSPVRRNT